jgi:hypothetical protein
VKIAIKTDPPRKNNMSTQKIVVQQKFPILAMLGILFVGLKLGNVINWSWWWVTCPFWIPFVIAATPFVIVGILGALEGILSVTHKLSQEIKRKRRRKK